MDKTDPVSRRILVTGRVQGVGFRWAARREALACRVTGWVRNCVDGSVEAVVEGEPAAVDRFVSWCRTGPPGARVSDVSVAPGPPHGRSTFDITG